MSSSLPLLQLGKIVAKDIARGGQSQGLRDLGEALASQPDAILEVLELLFSEARKKRPNSGLVTAFMFMLQQALEATRWRIENQPSLSTDIIDRVRASVASAATLHQLPPEILLMLAQCFAAAKLDVGEGLRNAIGASALQPPDTSMLRASPSPGDFESHLKQMADDLDHDPFLIHAQLADTFAGFPLDQRVEFISLLAASNLPSLREASVGWMLDRDQSLANEVAGRIAGTAAQGLVSAATVNRLIAMRNWVGSDLRPVIDVAIRAARQHGVAIIGPKAPQVTTVMASSCDGAGAQSYFVVGKEGRKHAIASLLVKYGLGVRDAWVARGKTKREITDLLNHIQFEVGGWNSSLAAVQTALAHGLAVNVRANEPIPFAVLQFVEAAGFPAIAPAHLDAEQLIDLLIAEIPGGATSDTAVSRALAASKHWDMEFVWVKSWFEDGATVMKAAGKEKGVKARAEAVLKGVVVGHRKKWTELLAWNALAARGDGDADEWIAFSLVARELLGPRPIGDIPIAWTIAKNSVAAMRDRT